MSGLKILVAVMTANVAVGGPLLGMLFLPLDVSFRAVPAAIYYPVAVVLTMALFVLASMAWWAVCKWCLDKMGERI